MSRARIWLAVFGLAEVAFVIVLFFNHRLSSRELRATLTPARLIADGYSEALLTMEGSPQAPQVWIVGEPHGVGLGKTQKEAGKWQAQIHGGVMPGKVQIRVSAAGAKPQQIALELTPQVTDSAGDGTPDFLRLEDAPDRKAFQAWFTFLGEVQYFTPVKQRPTEITDCSALVRYAYREALKKHDGTWAAEVKLPLLPAIPSIRKYNFPYTMLGPQLFRTRPGRYSPGDLNSGVFSQFANADTLRRYNTFRVSRDVQRAEPGDIFFYRQETAYHSMIFVGRSQVDPDTAVYVVYHTGPEGTSSGEVRRLSLNQLLHYPEPQWQPILANPNFLGVFRWNILKVSS